MAYTAKIGFPMPQAMIEGEGWIPAFCTYAQVFTDTGEFFGPDPSSAWLLFTPMYATDSAFEDYSNRIEATLASRLADEMSYTGALDVTWLTLPAAV